MANYERKIQPISCMKDKENTYKSICSKRLDAMKKGYYLESVHISYAIIEDRFHSLYYHLGYLTSREECRKCNKSVKKFYDSVFSEYKEVRKIKKKRKSIAGLSNKMLLLRALTVYTEKHNLCSEINEKYYEIVKERLQKFGTDKIYKLLDEMEEWRKVRNELTHALANKSIFDLKEKLQECSETGCRLSRELDSLVKVVKNYNSIRKSLCI